MSGAHPGFAARALAAAIGALLFAAGCQSPPPPTPPGAASVAPSTVEPTVRVAELELEDPARPRRIPLRVAYPAGPGRRAAPARGLPLVIFSHGAYSSKDDYAPLTDRWAARGYVVVSVTHTDSVSLGAVRGRPTPGAWSGRLADLQFLLAHPTAIERGIPALRGRIDFEHIAIAGHSLGGMVAQAFGGMTGLNPETRERYALHDPRIRAIVVLSGVGPLPPATQAADFATLSTPLFVSVGTLDLAMPQIVAKGGLELRREPYELAPAGHKYLLVLEGADHYLGGMVGRDDLPKSPQGALYVEAFDALSGRFLDAWLKGDRHAREELDRLAMPAAFASVASLSRG
jgi:pimeloyl-ACP methyl ester carboxylesterase